MILIKKSSYRRNGSILPMVAVGLVIFAVFLAFSLDIMRTIYDKSAMNYACKAAALAAYAFDPNEARLINSASADLFQNANFFQLISETLSNQSALYPLPKNMTPVGPDFTNNVSYLPATFNFSNNNLAANPADPSEIFLRVPMQNTVTNGLQMFFLPAMFIPNWGPDGTASATHMSQALMSADDEVVGQPASRIGAGPTQGQINASPNLVALADCVVFPLAITYNDFVNVVTNSALGTPFFFTLNSNTNSNNTTWQQAPSVSYPTLRTAFVDVAGFPGQSSYYQYNASSNIQDLQNLLGYFLPGFPGTPPGCVERGSKLSVIDPASLNTQQLSAITTNLNKIQTTAKRYFILPVVQQALPGSAGVRATVVGFALMKNQSMVSSTKDKVQFVFTSVGAIPLKNASASNDLAAVPNAFTGAKNFLPAVPPIYPFTARQYIQASNSITSRPISVALAPSLSARSTFHSFVF